MSGLKLCDDQSTWDNLILDYQGHPLQLWGWGGVKASHGWQTDRQILFNESDEFLAGGQLLVRRFPWPLGSLVYLPRGPIGKQSDFLAKITDYAKRKHRAMAVVVEPDELEFPIIDGWYQSEHRILANQTIILDLKKSEEELLADMAKKTRQYIKKSTREVTLKPIKTKEGIAECSRVYRQTARRAQFQIHQESYYYDIFEKLGDNNLILGAYQEGELLAFLWVVLSAETVYELYGGTTDRGRTTRANFALKWLMIQKTKEWGLARYDFGGLIDGGVSDFKLSWAKNKTTLAGTFVYPLVWYYKWLEKGILLVRRLKRSRLVAKLHKQHKTIK